MEEKLIQTLWYFQVDNKEIFPLKSYVNNIMFIVVSISKLKKKREV